MPSVDQPTGRTHRRGRPGRLLALAIVAGSNLVLGCSSTSVVSADNAAQQISDVLESEVGQRPDDVECPDDLEARVGEEMRCELREADTTYGVTIRITDVTDGVATFDIAVDSEPS